MISGLYCSASEIWSLVMMSSLTWPSLICPRGSCEFCRLENRLHSPERHPEAFQLPRVNFNAHRGRGASADKHLPNALNLRQLLLQDCRRQVVNTRHIVLRRCQSENHDRSVRGIHLAVRRIRRQVNRQISARRIDGRLDVASRAIDVTAQIKLQGHVGAAQRT